MPKVCANCVLLVDDESSIRYLLSIHLERAGFQAIHAKDGIDALVKLRDKIPSVIITDLKMPRMTGFEFIAVVRRRFPTIPIIAFTASMPSEFPGEAKPDFLLRKNVHRLPDVVQVVDNLARTKPDHVGVPQAVTTSVWTRLGLASYFMLSCTDCLRPFKVTRTPEVKAVEGTALCPSCDALIPFLIESSQAELTASLDTRAA